MGVVRSTCFLVVSIVSIGCGAPSNGGDPDAGDADGGFVGAADGSVDVADAGGSAVDAGEPTGPTLVFTLDGLKSNEGQVCHAVYPSAEGWPDDATRTLTRGCVATADTTNGLRIEGLPAGTTEVAVSLFHDKNSNDTLDEKSIFGVAVPAEPYAFSNDPAPTIGAPGYDACKVPVGPGENAFIVTFKSL